MSAPGETDLNKMLQTLGVEQQPGTFTYISVSELTPVVQKVAHATVTEGEVTTVVLNVEDAEQLGYDVVVRLVWLTLTVQSSLEAVGLTAELGARLTREGIPCNVLAGYFHDHLLVPVDRAEDAIVALIA